MAGEEHRLSVAFDVSCAYEEVQGILLKTGWLGTFRV